MIFQWGTLEDHQTLSGSQWGPGLKNEKKVNKHYCAYSFFDYILLTFQYGPQDQTLCESQGGLK